MNWLDARTRENVILFLLTTKTLFWNADRTVKAWTMMDSYCI